MPCPNCKSDGEPGPTGSCPQCNMPLALQHVLEVAEHEGWRVQRSSSSPPDGAQWVVNDIAITPHEMTTKADGSIEGSTEGWVAYSYNSAEPPKPEVLSPLGEGENYYFIGGGFKPRIALKIAGIPPCFWCGVPVTRPSMDGPLVCPMCDMGKNQDGSKKTTAQYLVGREHFATMIEKYKVKS